ncbi:Alpha-D-kanosaminyltransferase [Actinomadura rubteroloni]|uniref:Alpha-D-kanosaminyltransferase n=1 Tax=Actinomadura rubteroloni TaxID=1926885 RepID=A0A2P4UQV0_9ACTN|nr:glycosyltransferase [Actinomadura rubteroloni]POM27426.1 Alpha-D-kanosaminyltransferase [Actinomadura rubteroloni]
MTGDVSGLRIAIVNWRDPWHPAAGGAERYAWELARRFAARGAAVTYVTARAPGQRRRETVEGVAFARMGGTFTVYPRVLAWLLARRRRFDAVIDCQNGIPFFTPWVLPRGVPVFCSIFHVHDDQFGLYFPRWLAWIGRTLEGPVARRAYRRHACTAISVTTLDALRERLSWTGPVYLVPVGVTLPETPPAQPAPADPGTDAPAAGGSGERDALAPGGAAGRDMPAPGGTGEGGALAPGGTGNGVAAVGGLAGRGDPELVCVTRLVPHKQVERILDLAEYLRVRRPGVRVGVVGRGPEEERLAALVRERGLGDVVTLHGFVSEEAKAALVARADLHLSASRGEGWGLCVAEAAALGVPTVAYDVDGLRDAVRDGVTGWLAAPGDALAATVERALKELDDPVRRAAIRDACREWAAEFDWARSADRMGALLAAAVRRGTSGTSDSAAHVLAGYGAGTLVAEGPLRDRLVTEPGVAVLRPATARERLLGRALDDDGGR